MSYTTYPKYFTGKDFRVEDEETVKRKVDALVSAMTFDEKCSLLGGEVEPEDKGKIGNAGYQWGVPRLGVPEVVMYDGPAGITGIVETTGLPQPALLGCTWDDEMAYSFGKISASENAACSGNFLLAPQVDVIRTPRFGRNKDMKSEDSYLGARLAVAETRGVQDQHVVATLKHFTAANVMDGFGCEPRRIIVDEQTLHEKYLKPFEEAILKGHAGSVMNAYNVVNEGYMTANASINIGVLRDQWGFKGSLMSDWGAVHGFTLNKGMDMEMPYPAYTNKTRIIRNIERGRYSFEELDEACRHVLYGMSVVGLLALVKLDEDGRVIEEPDRTEPIQMEWTYDKAVAGGLLEKNAKSAAEIVREGAVLVRNENQALPLKKKDFDQNVVLVGVGAKYPLCGEQQERSFGRLERMIPPAQAFEEATGKKLPVYAGIDYVGEAVPAKYLYQDKSCRKKGVRRLWGISDEDRNLVSVNAGPGGAGNGFSGERLLDEDGEIVDTGMASYGTSAAKKVDADLLGKVAAVDPQIDFTVGADVRNYLNGPDGTAFTDGISYTWKGFLKAPEDGEYTMRLECVGGEGVLMMQLDGEWQLIGNAMYREWTQWPWEMCVNTPEGMGISGEKLEFKKGGVYPFIVYGRQAVKNKDLQIRLAWSTPSEKKACYEEAMDAVSKADTVIYYASSAGDVLSSMAALQEDREKTPSIELSAEQEHMIEDAIAHRKAGGKFIVVLQTSNAKAIGKWADKVDAILITYMPGQEGSRVITEILTGKTNPSGKLSQTWPKKSEDLPTADTPEHVKKRELGYRSDGELLIEESEGIFTGYRWYDKEQVEPQYAFGFGLSYTSYEYSDLALSKDKDGFLASFTVKNVGKVKGDEIAQLYLGAAEVPAHIQMAEKALAGYVRVKNLKPGESRRVEIPIEERSLCYWNPAKPLKERPDGTKDKWERASGRRKVYVGASSRDIRLTGEIEVKD